MSTSKSTASLSEDAPTDFEGVVCRLAQRGNLRQLRSMRACGILPVKGTSMALLYAVANGHEECVELLLYGTCTVFTLSRGLCLAAVHGYTGIVRILVAARAHPDPAVGFDGYGPPLTLAAAHGREHVVQLLLHFKAVPCGACTLMRTAACEAARHGHCGVLAQLAHVATKTWATSLTMAAHAAAATDQVNALKFLFAVKVHVDDKSFHHDTPLHFAVANEAHRAAEYLILQAKANIEACDSQLRTALWMAAGKKSCRMLRLLLRAKANVDWHSDDPHGCYVSTPLGEAAKHGIAAHVRLLLRAKADPTIADANACTPATHAERRGDVAMAALLRGQVP
jgi:ankyrin repeat protein